MPTCEAEITKIYALLDPRSGELRYVGKTRQPPHQRLLQHISKTSKARTHTGYWIRNLLSAGVSPEMLILDTVTGTGAAQESDLIELLSRSGYRLTNIAPGGEGCSPAASTRAKLSQTMRGLWASPLYRKAMTSRRASPETKKKMSRTFLGRTHSDTVRRRLSDINKGKRMSPETKAKIADALRKSLATPEAREIKRAAALKWRADKKAKESQS